MKNSFLFILLVIFSCGKALALPQDWSCEEIFVHKTKEIQKNDVSYRNLYFGKNRTDSLSIELEGMYEYPNAIINCGTAGCSGIMTNLQTNISENMRFDCSFTKDKDTFACHWIDNDEYLLTLAGCGLYERVIRFEKLKRQGLTAYMNFVNRTLNPTTWGSALGSTVLPSFVGSFVSGIGNYTNK